MSKSRLIAVVGAGVLLFSAATTQATTWVWEADNHTGTSPDYTSMWTDGVHSFVKLTQSGGWDVLWDSPMPGWATVMGGQMDHSPPNGRFILKTDFGGSSNNSADPANYWDMYTGVTVTAGINIPAVDGASGNGSLLVGVNNPSTVGLKNSNFFCGYLGWDENGSLPGGVGINFWTPSGGAFRTMFAPSVNVIGVETIWTLALKRLDDPVGGNTIVWDLWINGVAQAQDAATGILGPDGNYHTLVGFKNSSEGTSIYIGERRSQPFNHETQWDYLNVRNRWVPEPASLLLLAVGSGLMVIRRRRR